MISEMNKFWFSNIIYELLMNVFFYVYYNMYVYVKYGRINGAYILFFFSCQISIFFLLY